MIKFEHLQKSYRDKVIFDNVNFQLTEVGRIYTIIGSSGSGKTTLLNIIFGLDLDYQGTYQLFDRLGRYKCWSGFCPDTIFGFCGTFSSCYFRRNIRLGL